MSNRSIPSAFLKSVLQNGAGRYVGQLQRVTFKVCKEQGGSRGMRKFLENQLIDFSRGNSGIAVYVQVRRHRNPVIIGEYLNGETHTVQAVNYNEEEVAQWLDWLRTRSGVPLRRLRKYHHTDTPSIQGTWTPNTNKPSELNIKTFPDDDLSAALQFEPTVSEHLLKELRKLKISESSQDTPSASAV